MRLPVLLSALTCVVSASCAGFAPLTVELAEALASRAPPEPKCERRSASVEIESERISGTFQALLVARAGPQPAVRLQLFPELGGKVLDLAASGTRVVGYFPQANLGLELDASGLQHPPRHLLLFLAASLLESATRFAPARVLGARPVSARHVRSMEHLHAAEADRSDGELMAGGAGVWELELAPALAGVQVRALVDGSGRLIGRHWSSRGVRWSESFEPVHEFRARGFALRILDESREPVDELPDALFELELPQQVAR